MLTVFFLNHVIHILLSVWICLLIAMLMYNTYAYKSNIVSIWEDVYTYMFIHNTMCYEK